MKPEWILFIAKYQWPFIIVLIICALFASTISWIYKIIKSNNSKTYKATGILVALLLNFSIGYYLLGGADSFAFLKKIWP